MSLEELIFLCEGGHGMQAIGMFSLLGGCVISKANSKQRRYGLKEGLQQEDRSCKDSTVRLGKGSTWVGHLRWREEVWEWLG